MRTKEQMMDEYEMYSHKIVKSKDVKHMEILADVCEWLFCQAATKMPEAAESALSHLASAEWNNYLSETEAKNIGMRIVNQDGTKGFHWDYNTFTKAVESLGGVVEEKPYYNSYSLWVVSCTIYSDHALSIAMDMGYKTPAEVPNEKMALSCYRKAVEKLKDIDGGFHVRKYFKHKMYADYPM